MGINFKFLKNGNTQLQTVSGGVVALGSLFLLYKNYSSQTALSPSLCATASVSPTAFEQINTSFDSQKKLPFSAEQLESQVKKMKLIESKIEALCTLERTEGISGLQEGEFQSLQNDMLLLKELLYADRLKTLKEELKKLKKNFLSLKKQASPGKVEGGILSFKNTMESLEVCFLSLKDQGAIFETDALFTDIEQLKRDFDKFLAQGAKHIKSYQSLDSEGQVSLPKAYDELVINTEDLLEIPSDGSCLYHSLYTYGVSKGLFSSREIPHSKVLKANLIEYLKKKWKHRLKGMSTEMRHKSTVYASLLHVYLNVREDKAKKMREDIESRRFLLESQKQTSIKRKLDSLNREYLDWEKKYPPFDPHASPDIFIEKSFEFLIQDGTWGGDEIVHAFINWMYEKKKCYVPVVWMSSKEAFSKREKGVEKLFIVSHVFSKVDHILISHQKGVKTLIPMFLWHKNHTHFNLYLKTDH